MSTPSLEIAVQPENTSVPCLTTTPEDAIVKITDTTFHNGRKWSIMTLCQKAKQVIQNQIQQIKRGSGINFPSLSTYISNGCRAIKRSDVDLYGSAIGIVIGVALISWGIFCVEEGYQDNPSYACSRDEFDREAHAKWNGQRLFVAGIAAFILGMGTYCRHVRIN